MKLACRDKKLWQTARAEENIMVRAEDDRLRRAGLAYFVANFRISANQVVALFLLWVHKQQWIMRHDEAADYFGHLETLLKIDG